MNEKVLNRSPRLPGLPDSTNHEAPDSVVQRQFLAFFYGCFENQEKRTNVNYFSGSGWKAGMRSASCSYAAPVVSSSKGGFREGRQVLLFLVKR